MILKDARQQKVLTRTMDRINEKFKTLVKQEKRPPVPKAMLRRYL